MLSDQLIDLPSIIFLFHILYHNLTDLKNSNWDFSLKSTIELMNNLLNNSGAMLKNDEYNNIYNYTVHQRIVKTKSLYAQEISIF